MTYILITGASSGIGEAFAHEYAKRGKNVILVARTEDKLRTLAEELRTRHSVQAEILRADLSTSAGVTLVATTCQSKGWEIEVLVNNAGFGLFGPLAGQDAKRVEEMQLLNVVALTQLARHFVPQMIERRGGGIINVASTAAFQPIPGFAVYAATKAYVLSLSEALHAEVKPHGVTVTALCPGPTETNFFDHSAGIKVKMQSPQEVARAAVIAFERKRDRVIPGGLNRVMANSVKFIPRTLVMKTAAAFMKGR